MRRMIMKLLKILLSFMIPVALFLNCTPVNSNELKSLNLINVNDVVKSTSVIPAAVTDFTAQPTGMNSVRLTWSAVKDADGYIVYRKTGDGKFMYRYMVSGLSYTDTTAVTGEYNFYRVYAYKNINGKRILGPSKEYKYAKPVLNPVTSLKLQVTGTSSVKLTWNPVINADGYIIYRKIDKEDFIYRYMVKETSFIDSSAKTGVYNFYRVYPYKIVNGKRVLGPSTVYKYGKPMPSAVTNLKMVAQGENIKIAWNTSVNVTGYIIYRKGPDDDKFSYRYIVSNPSFIDTKFDKQGYYFYRVYAYKTIDGVRILGPSNNYVYGYHEKKFTNHSSLSHSKAEIIAAYRNAMPKFNYNNNIYETMPSTSAPYRAGVLKQGVVDDTLNQLNFFRWMAGLNPVIVNKTYMDRSQKAAVLLKANDVLTHYPEQPDDMDDDFYAAGAAGAGAGYGYSGNCGMSTYHTMPQSIQNYINDDHNMNAGVGHRLSMLYPSATSISFGYVKPYNAVSVYYNNNYESSKGGDSFYSWPSPGYFPIEIITPQSQWSIQLDDAYHFIDNDVEFIYKGKKYQATNYVYDNFYNALAFSLPDELLNIVSDNKTFNNGDTITVSVHGVQYGYSDILNIQYPVNFMTVK